MAGTEIDYGAEHKKPDEHGNYILMKAGLTNRKYTPAEFLTAIDVLEWPDTVHQTRISSLGVARVVMEALAKRASSVTIRDFEPNQAELERIMQNPIRTYHSD